MSENQYMDDNLSQEFIISRLFVFFIQLSSPNRFVKCLEIPMGHMEVYRYSFAIE